MDSKDNESTIQLDRYTPEAKALVAGAQSLADERKHIDVDPLHLLSRSLDRDPAVVEIFRRCGADPTEIASLAEASLRRLPRSPNAVSYLSRRLLDLLGRAEREASSTKAPSVGLEHLLNALSQEISGPVGDILSQFQIGPGAFRPHLSVLRSFARDTADPKDGPTSPRTIRGFTRDLVDLAKKTPNEPVIGLDSTVRRLLQILERKTKNHPLIVGEPGVGKTAIIRALATRIAAGDVPSNLKKLRLLELDTGAIVAGARLRGELEERVKKLMETLSSENGDGDAVLVIEGFDALLGQGAAGSGVGDLLKPILSRADLRFLGTSTTEGLRKIQERDPSLLRRVTMLTIDAPSVAQATEILRGIAPRYEAHHTVKISEGAVCAAVQLAKRYIQDRALPDSAIDLLDEAAARKRVETDGIPAEIDDLIRRLASLKSQEKSLEDDTDDASIRTRAALGRERAELEPRVNEARSKFESRRGAQAAVQQLKKDLTQAQTSLEKARKEQAFARLGELEHVTVPDLQRRLDAAEQALARAGGPEQSATVNDQDIAVTLGEWTGIPVARMLEAETEKLLHMEERLRKRVVGQDEALKALCRAVRRGRVGLRDPGRPIGSFLFLGPSGVGKTELAKALAEFLFDDEQAMTRLDMSEFMEKHMAQRLVGAPPGYVDSEQGGFLTEAVRRRPYSVLLFDEVEKAHSDVFNLLLQVLDDGRLTDGRGRLADFSNTVVIMTSNIGAPRILETAPHILETTDGREALRDVLLTELRGFFRPEFLNRVDDIIVFGSLSKENLLGVVEIQLKRLHNLLKDRELTVVLSDAAKRRIVELGYEPAFGARPLRRALLKEIQDPLAEEILSGHWLRGDCIKVDLNGDAFVSAKANELPPIVAPPTS